MSKEYMQALEDLFGLVAFQGSFEKAQKYFDIIEEALQRLESIDNAEPSEALIEVDKILGYFGKAQIETMTLSKRNVLTIKQALQRLDRYEQILSNGRLTDRNYKNTTLDLDSCKPYLRLGQLEDIYEEGK